MPESRGIGPIDVTHSPFAALQAQAVELREGFWRTRQQLNVGVGLPHGYRKLEESGNFHNLALAAGQIQGQYKGPLFIDSDLYKWLEGVIFTLQAAPDPQLAAMAERAIELIMAAQAPDGYLNTFYQVVEPQNRWKNIHSGHELYCAGHLMQAAVAHVRATGDERLLGVACRFADHIGTIFGPGRLETCCGHPEIETALIELYRLTRRQSYLDMAAYFIDMRGKRTVVSDYGILAYYQDQTPVREATAVVGHAVRQLYLCAGVTDLFLETGEVALLDSQKRLWGDMTTSKMYVTGGVGSRPTTEGFGEKYELPTDTAYCETCAAIASIFWSYRMLLATAESRFADLMESTLYNAFLAGVSLGHDRYFYVNPVLSRGGIERPEWHGCSCCPPNVMRLLASLQHYLCTTSREGIQCHQYAAAKRDTRFASLVLDTVYPWQGICTFRVERTQGAPWELSLRIPGWCTRASLTVNGQAMALTMRRGYAVIMRAWHPGDTVELNLLMEPRLVAGHPNIESVRHCAAITRGPLVYCIEQADLDGATPLLDVRLDGAAPLEAVARPELLGGITMIGAMGRVIDGAAWQERLYQPLAPPTMLRGVRLSAVPYYAWANRSVGAMRVWIPLV
ncbi:MAG: glycoside hydrolase family 127 protein [Phycisphaerae bacterium]|nr:glycoside hydrolase family 127 protein [Phycisphaerae bacterium]